MTRTRGAPPTAAIAPAPRCEVCFLTCLLDAQNSHTRHYAQSLGAHQFQVVIVSPGHLPAGRLPWGARHVALPAVHDHFPHYRMPWGGLVRGLWARMRNSLLAVVALTRLRPGIVAASEPDALAVAVFLKPFLGHRVVAYLREVYEDRLMAFPRWSRPPLIWLLRAALRLLVAGSDEVIHMNRQRQSLHAFCRKPGVIVTYCPPRTAFAWAPAWAAARAARPPRPQVNVLHAGPLRLSYGADELLEAIEIVAAQQAGVRFFVVGGLHDPRTALARPERLEALERSGRLRLLPPVPFAKVISLLKVADIGLNLVKPVDHGHRLAQPRKLFEYLAAGVPVVGADVPSIAEVIAKWQCGLAVDCASPSAIAAAILRLTLDPDERRRCAANALRAAREEYCWEAQEPRFLEVFQRLGGPAPTRPQSPPAP